MTIQSECQKLSKKYAKATKQAKKGMYKILCDSMDGWQKQFTQVGTRSSNVGNKHPVIKFGGDGRDDYGNANMVTVSYMGLSFRVHEAHFDKLQRLFDRSDVSEDTHFSDALFCLLCRYDTLQGAGLQAAVPGAVLDVLLKHWDCRMECFASPLNCRYEAYCSAFGKLDAAFGSLGSFFDVPVGSWPSGTYQVNPPFCEGLISKLAKRLVKHVRKTKDLRFVVFVPVWPDSSGHQALKKGAKHHLQLAAAKHYYAEGTQHRRFSRFRVASFDTSVFVFESIEEEDTQQEENEDGKEQGVDGGDVTEDKVNGNGDEHEHETEQGDDMDDATRVVLEEIKAAFESDPQSEPEVIEPKVIEQKVQVTTAAPSFTKEQGIGLAPETPTKGIGKSNKGPSTTSNSRQSKRKEKRKWTDKDEGRAQLDLLQTLGLTNNGDTADRSEKAVAVSKKKKASSGKKGKR